MNLGINFQYIASGLRGGSAGQSYKVGIISAVTDLKDRGGSSSLSIKDHVQANLPAGKSLHNTSFMRALKKAVDDGLLSKVNNSYKLSNGTRRNLKEAAAEKYMTKPKPPAYSGLRAEGHSDTNTKKEESTLLERMRRLAKTKKKVAPNKKAVSCLCSLSLFHIIDL